MKKGVNILWVLAVLISVAILILSCFECVHGISYDNSLVSSMREPYVKTYSLFLLTSIPTVFSILMSFANSKLLNFFACVIVLFQSITVTFANKFYKSIDELIGYIGQISYDYNMTVNGIVLALLCWSLVLVIVAMTIGRFGEKQEDRIDSKATKAIVAVLSTLLTLVSVPILIIRAMIVTEISAIIGMISFFITEGLIFFAYYFSIRKTIKTSKRKYLWIMVAVIVLFLIQIFFRDIVRDTWMYCFRTLKTEDTLNVLN